MSDSELSEGNRDWEAWFSSGRISKSRERKRNIGTTRNPGVSAVKGCPVLWRPRWSRPEKVRECFLEEKPPEMTQELMNRSSLGRAGACVFWRVTERLFQVEEGYFVKVWRPKSLEVE